MSASLWSGDASLLNMPEHIATQHAPVLPPPVTLSGSQLPAPGAVAIVATDTPLGKGALPLFKSALESVKGIELQYGAEQVNEKTRAIIWLDSSAAQMGTLEELLVKYKDIGFVQMPMAGINAYSPLVKKYKDRVWTSAKGAFAQPVAEHAFTLALALLRFLPMRIRAKAWGPNQGFSFYNRKVLVLGAGGITLSLLTQMAPFHPTVTILRRKAEPLAPENVPEGMQGRVEVSTLSSLESHLPEADVVIVACALTSDTRGCLGYEQFKKLPKHAIVVNVARGEVLQQDGLVRALQEGLIGGAGIDVTEPEPLPESSPLWGCKSSHPSIQTEDKFGGAGLANLIITPHCADTFEMVAPLLAVRFKQNVEAFLTQSGRFEGIVDGDAGY